MSDTSLTEINQNAAIFGERLPEREPGSHRQPAAAQLTDSRGEVPIVPGELHGSFVCSTDSAHINLQRNEVIKALTIPEHSLDRQPERVIGFKPIVENLPERTDVSGPFNNFDDFCNRGVLKVATPAREYSFTGRPVKVIIPERYAALLDDIAAGKSTATEAEDYSQRLTPADLPPLLDAMPNSGYFKRIYMSDKRNPEDAWVNQGRSNEFVTAMSMIEGELTMYKTSRTAYVRRDVLHEWSHELRYEYWEDDIFARFGNAVDLETDWKPSDYAGRNNGEHWAVLGERMIGNNAKDFLDAAENAPIRTMIWMRALKLCLDNVPAENRSIDHDLYVARQKYVDDQVLPLAVNKLNDFVKRGTAEQQRLANDILDYFRSQGLIK